MKQCQAWIALREVGEAETLLPAFARLREQAYPWWLDSALSDGERGRFSFAGADPYLVCRARGRRVACEVRRNVRADLPQASCVLDMDPFEVLRWAALARPSGAPVAAQFPFVGGAVGCLSYELARHLEDVPLRVDAQADFAELCLLFVDRILIFDHGTQKLWASALGFGATQAEARLAADASLTEWSFARADFVDALPRETDLDATRKSFICANATSTLCAQLDAAQYAKQVARIQEHITAGDLYQACLTHALTVAVPEAVEARDMPWALYQALRAKNPAPFAAFLQWPEGSILCSSPERFLSLRENREVESRPIKGTRPRGATPQEDTLLRDELVCSSKDRAENLMIADLVRNDLGRVCEIGSVHADALMMVETYANLFQMVSSIRGRLREDCDAVDLLRAAFPPGSMTGAPKIAAMRLLAELEAKPRGVYSGALGYFDLRGGLDLAVVIRTILLAQGRAQVQTGGGIVADSIAAQEYRESLDKARALLAVLGVALR